MKALYRDIGYDLPLRLWTDSSAAVGICSRQGLGKLRHLECTSFWIQQRIRLGELEVRKIAGEENPADLYTKHLESKAKIEQLVNLFGGEFRDGRPAAAPQLRADPVAASMAGVMTSVCGSEPGFALVLPHLIDPNDMDSMYEIVKIDEGDNSEWTQALRPAEELADPGPRGKLEFTPSSHRDAALTVQVIEVGNNVQQQQLTETKEDDYPKIDCRKRGQEKRSIDEETNHDAHCTRQKGDVPSNGGRSRWRGSRSFPRSLRPSFVKADEHLRGHPQRHCVRTNATLACHRSDGCARSSLSIARSVGECLDDMSNSCLLYTSPSPRDATLSRMPSSA